MEKETLEQMPKRQKCDSSSKAKAFNNVYETVDEREYTKIVDDNGSGTVKNDRDVFDDDDFESIAGDANARGKGVKRKVKDVSVNAGPSSDKNASNLQSNLAYSKKTQETKLEHNLSLSALLDEIDKLNETSDQQNDVIAAQSYSMNLSSSLEEPSATSVVSSKSRLDQLLEDILIYSQTPLTTQTDDTDNTAVATAVVDDDHDDFVDLNNASFLFTDRLRFYWWDAFEDRKKHPGVVFLFGKTYSEKDKAFVSCCVAVKNIERKLFFLPKPFDEKSQKPITTEDVYDEINKRIMEPLCITEFKACPVSKKYAFDSEIPAESDYIEVRYAAKDRSMINSMKNGRTFSKIFGTESSYLEIFLLDCKIKGPCWLDIYNFNTTKKPYSWCHMEYHCNRASDVTIIAQMEKPLPPPPLIVAAITMRCIVNPKNSNNEIVMLSCVSHTRYCVDKQPPDPPFQKHFCVLSGSSQQPLPLNLNNALINNKATTVEEMDSEKALLIYFINQMARIDADLVVGHDLDGYQINILCDRLIHNSVANISELGRLRHIILLKQKLEKNLFVGRLVCDIKISTKELIKSRSYDLDTLCQSVLNFKEGQRIDLEPEDIPKMFYTCDDVSKLISLTMQDATSILKIMYCLNIIPLALQITNIAGNVMSGTLMGGRSERNEFMLMHAFSEKGYIIPDKEYRYRTDGAESSGKKATYSGGLVLEPKVGFYNKFILLMDFNSLYPSIIQEYNICFTTIPISLDLNEDNIVLPDETLPPGVLPTEICKLVESRREVKKLMNSSDISNDLKTQYNIRQMALKLTANSMYGCLGFTNSRFYARNLAALITLKGRELLTNTQCLVEKLNLDVIYGDTDSIMINTNITDYDEVFKIGHKIKQEVNKLYRQIELDIDGVYKYLLLLKKKKYAGVKLTKDAINNTIKSDNEYKGLDIVRRDWSRLSSNAGYFVLDQIFNDQSHEDRINNIQAHLIKLKDDLKQNRVPLSLLLITKQLTKNPSMYTNKQLLPHVQVALRYNEMFGGHYRSGDTVSYLICDDGTRKSLAERAYHVKEYENSPLHIDVAYYLEQQIHPVITRICEPIDGLGADQIAGWLGLDNPKNPQNEPDVVVDEKITKWKIKFRNVDLFSFKCIACNHDNIVREPPSAGRLLFLEKCTNAECNVRPVDYIISIKHQLRLTLQSYIMKYYLFQMRCDDLILCSHKTKKTLLVRFVGRYPLCTVCKKSLMRLKYNADDLNLQLEFFQFIFDVSKGHKKPLDDQIKDAYKMLRLTVEELLCHSRYANVNLGEIFSLL